MNIDVLLELWSLRLGTKRRAHKFWWVPHQLKLESRLFVLQSLRRTYFIYLTQF